MSQRGLLLPTVMPTSSPPAAGKTTRLDSIDILRAVAIVLMVQTHFVSHLSWREESSALLHVWSEWLGYAPAPLFCLMAGLSYSIWLQKELTAGRSEKKIDVSSMRRGGFLFVLGLLFALCIWLPEEIFGWDILTLLGSSFVLLAGFRRLPPVINIFICAMILLVAPVMRALMDYPAYWLEGEFSYDPFIREILYGYISNGFFPLLPWLAMPLAGFVIGETVFQAEVLPAERQRMLFRWGVGLMGLAILCLLVFARLPYFIARHYGAGLTFYPASAEFLILITGTAMVALAALNRWIDGNPAVSADSRVLRVFRRYSSFALTVYVVHHMAHIWPLWLYGIVNGHDDPTHYYQAALSTPAAFALAVVFLVIFYPVLGWLERHRRWSIESLLRRVAD